MRVIAIDGPAGSGKSTVSRRLAERLGLRYLDTGAMYRAVAFAALRRDLDPDDDDPVAALARNLTLDVSLEGVTVDGVDATVEIRGPEVTRAVSTVAANPGVREELRRRQREWAIANGGGGGGGRGHRPGGFPAAGAKGGPSAAPRSPAPRRGDGGTA